MIVCVNTASNKEGVGNGGMPTPKIIAYHPHIDKPVNSQGIDAPCCNRHGGSIPNIYPMLIVGLKLLAMVDHFL